MGKFNFKIGVFGWRSMSIIMHIVNVRKKLQTFFVFYIVK